MIRVKPVFIRLTSDSVFKYFFKSKYRWFYRDLIYKYTNIDINEYSLYDNEINFGKTKGDFRLDIVLINRNKREILNIEMNTYNCLKRNEMYLHSLSTLLYKNYQLEKMKDLYDVKQINLNLFKTNSNDLNTHIGLRDKNSNIIIKNFQIYNCNLLNQTKKSYNKDKLLKLLVCNSYEEMEQIAKGEKRLMEIVEELKVLGNEDDFLSVYSPEADMKLKLSEAREYGKELGETTGVEKTARNMLKIGIPIGQIQECTGMSESAVRALM